MNRLNKMLINTELGDISQVMVSLYAVQYNGGVYIEYMEDFANLLNLTNDSVAKAIQSIKFDSDYNKAMVCLEGVGDNIKKLLSYQFTIRED